MEPYIGQIQVFPYTFAPEGWLECNGALLQIMQNQALYSLLGIMFGGDGRSTFGIPDLRGVSPDPNTKYYIATTGIYPQRP